MPLFSGTHANDTIIQYSTVQSDPAHYVDNDGGDTAFSPGKQAKQPNVDISSELRNDSGLNSEEGEKGPHTYTGPPVKGWPTAPQRLRGYSVPLLIGDILLICLPILFIVLGISAWRLDGKTLSGHGKMVERAMSLGPTVYPLAFAAIGSRCLRNVAIRLAERGTTVLTLEKLLGSQSLVSAIGTACSLRSANLISIGLLLLWALSPLGGQSSLRLLHETNSTALENGTVYYSDHAAPADFEEASWRKIIPTIITASLSTSQDVKIKPVDIWSHPKVPRLDIIEQQAISDPLAEGTWVDVNPTANQTYSSWTGINVQNLRQNEHAAFQVKYNYVYFDQQSVSLESPKVTYDNLVASTAVFPPLNGTPKTDQEAMNIFENITSAGTAIMPGPPRQQLFLRAGYPLNDTQKGSDLTTMFGFSLNRGPVSFMWGEPYLKTDGSNRYLYQMYSYTPRIVTVDAQIECEARDCSVTRLRHVPSESAASLENACNGGQTYRIGCITSATYTLFHFLRYIPATLASYGNDAGVFELWLKGNNVTFVIGENPQPNLISDKEKSNRITTLLNTYWQASAWGYQITRDGFLDKPDYPWTGSPQSTAPERYMNASEAVFSHPVPIYEADIGWIVSLLIISIILLVLGIMNVAFAFLTIAPDLFYYASSLARENPYTKTPDGGTALDGAQRSRMLKDMQVQIADVSPESRVGYVVLKSVDDGDFQAGRLQKSRLYW